DHGNRISVLLGLLAIASVGAAVPVLAADADVTDAADAGGYYGQSSSSGEQETQSEASPRGQEERKEQERALSQRQLASRYWAPDVSGLPYQPGFRGCAPTAQLGQLGYLGGMRSALLPLPPVPQRDSGRYVRLGVSVGETYTDNVE